MRQRKGLHAVYDERGRPIVMLLSEGQMSDHKGAAALLNVLPTAKELGEDRGYDSDGFRAAPAARGITPYIPPRKNRKVQHPYCEALFRHVSATKLRICSPGSWTGTA
jgi:transposase